MRAALLQITGSDDPGANLDLVGSGVTRAHADGAGFILTPEVTNCVSLSRSHQMDVLHHEADDPMLAEMRDLAARLGIWLNIGSLALKIEDEDEDGRLANRSFLIGPDGGIVGRYDKIHMFDVQISGSETYRESDGFRPGNRAVLADTEIGAIGLSICYDLRFPALYRALAKAGAEIITVPAAFSPVTGVSHWEPLLRARAIETGAFVLAAAQCGTHPAASGRQRRTHGHSMAISPWGEILAVAGEDPTILFVDLDLADVDQARRRIPSLTHDRPFAGPG